MFKRVLFSILAISSVLVFNSCDDESAKEHRKFNLDLDDYRLFPEGSNWTYVKPHEDQDSVEYEFIELMEVKEEFVPSEFGDYFVMKREDIFWTSRDSMLYSAFTEEVQIEIDGELTEVFKTAGPDFVYYSDIHTPGFRYPNIIVDWPNLNYPNHYWYGGLVGSLADVGTLGDLISPFEAGSYLAPVISKLQGFPETRRVGNGAFYEYSDELNEYIPTLGHKERFIAKEVGDLIKLDMETLEIWLLIDFNIAEEE